VSAFVKSWIEPAAQIRHQLQDSIETDEEFRNELKGLLASEIEDQIDLNIELGPRAAGEPVQMMPEQVHEFYILEIEDARKTSEAEYLVTVFVEADVDISATERIDTGSWRIDDVIETRSLTKTIDFRFDSIYRDGIFSNVRMTYPA
jgi:hypothetical protein